MNSKHRKTLEAIFLRPTPSGLRWEDIEALLHAVGATLTEGRGSRLRAVLGGVAATFHRPHPGPLAKKGAVESIREFLANAGVTP